MQSRKVVTRSGRKFRGYFPSRKLNRMVEWESLLERDAILYFEFSPGIINYQEQPEVIFFDQGGEMHRYHPDFAITLKDGRVIYIEVKPWRCFDDPELVERFGAIKGHYAKQDKQFRILTDRLLRKEPKLSNLKMLASVVQFPLGKNEVSRFVDEVISFGPHLSLSTLANSIGWRNVLGMIANHHFHCDFDIAFHSPENFVQLMEEADHDALLI